MNGRHVYKRNVENSRWQRKYSKFRAGGFKPIDLPRLRELLSVSVNKSGPVKRTSLPVVAGEAERRQPMSTAIEWTDATWNPMTGCTKVSTACKHCYAERMAERLQAMGNPRYRNGFELTLHHDKLMLPLEWRKPCRIFVDSMSDLFHKDVPESFIRRVFEVMVRADWHVFQVLTKRSERLAELAPRLPWPPNVWQGVSVENADYTFRVADLVKVPAAVRFLSVEPLLGPIPDLPLAGIDWVIVGGESGDEYRPVQPEWVREIRDQCVAAGVPFFFKQWGGRTSKSGGRLLDGREWSEYPERRPRRTA
jgi:protein gp37